MSQLILTRHSQFHRTLRTGGVMPLSLRIGKFFLFFTMTIIIGIISFFYLVKFTEIHTKGYQLSRLEIQKNKLTTQQEAKNTDISKAKSLTSVRQAAIELNMIAAPRPLFVSLDSQLAQASLPPHGP